MICEAESIQVQCLEVVHTVQNTDKMLKDVAIQRPTSDFRQTKSMQVAHLRQNFNDVTERSLLNFK